MNIPRFLLPLGLLLTSFLSYGQTNGPTKEEVPYIEVNGTAEKEVVPDEIYINIIIREKYVNREKITIESQEEKLKSYLLDIGVDLANLYLSDANADYMKVRWRTKDVLTQKDYTLKVATATTVGQVFQQLDKLEITDASIAKVNHSAMDSLKKEVKIQAIKAAKDKADYLLAAIGEQVGKPLVIHENENKIYEPGRVYGTSAGLVRSYSDGVKIQAADNTDIQFNKIKIQTHIYAKFSIK